MFALGLVSFCSCNWEKVKYQKFEDETSISNKVSSLKLDSIPIQSIGTKEIEIPITISGLYSDAKDYRLSDLNSIIKVYYQIENSTQKVLCPFRVVNDDGLKIKVYLPPIVSNSTLFVYVNGIEMDKKIVKVDEIAWELNQINGDADSWTNHANIHFSISVPQSSTTSSNEANSNFISSRLVATIKEENTSNERRLNIDPTAKEEDLTINGLKPSTAYIVTYKIEGTNKSISKKIETESIETIPNASFEDWSQYKKNGNYWELEYPYNKDDIPDKHWDTLNNLTCRYGLDRHKTTLRYRANSSTIPTEDAHTGHRAAIVRTVAYGANATAAGGWSLGVMVSTGSLYLGSFNDDILKDENNLPNLGIPFNSRPRIFSFWAKYKPVNKSDNFIAEMALIDSEGNKIAEAVLPKEDAMITQGNEYKQYNIPLEYKTLIKKPSKMYIRFVSGVNKSDKTNNINYGSISPSAEHIGSQLFIDDISIIY